jgi:hypothetical protein
VEPPEQVEPVSDELELPDFTPDEARVITEEIKTSLAVAYDKILIAFKRRAWKGTGYDTWETYCAEEFTNSRMVRLSIDQRREVVGQLMQEGMSTRAIAGALGVSHMTVQGDKTGVQDFTPEVVVGLDGKTYRAQLDEPDDDIIESDDDSGNVYDWPEERPRRAERTDVVLEMNECLERAREAREHAEEIKPGHIRARSERIRHSWKRELDEQLEVLLELSNNLGK